MKKHRNRILYLVITWLCGIGLLTSGGYWFGYNKVSSKRQVENSPDVSITSGKLPVSGVVLPHHDIVKGYRQEFLDTLLDTLGDNLPETIVVVSPNHLASGSANVQTSDKVWETSAGTMNPNSTVLKALQDKGIPNDPTSIGNEDGIRYVIGDLAARFPKATVVPISLKDTTTYEDIELVNKAISEACTSCLLVASVDFSHYQPSILADLHDRVTVRLMQELDESGLLKKAEVDSPAALALLSSWAKLQDTRRLTVKRHTNTGKMGNDPDAESTSHLFAWYERGEIDPAQPEVSFTIGGDMMFGRMIAHTFPESKLATVGSQLGNRVFWGSDASIVNLEGPVSPTPVPDDIRANNLTFNFPPETIQALKNLKVDGVSLANNHTANAGIKGLESTRSLLSSAKIAAIGGPGEKDVVQVGSFVGNDLTLKVVGVHLLSTQPDITPLIRELAADPKNRVMVLPHWGNEYQQKHASSQERLAHLWIDAGADAVIGSHPHVIQDTEVYKEKPIFYSMGNLLFDQTFSTETQQGVIVAGTFTEKGIELFALPTGMKKYQPLMIRGNEKKELLDTLYKGFGYTAGTDSRDWSLVLP